jgi:acyl-ACP thioesterase
VPTAADSDRDALIPPPPVGRVFEWETIVGLAETTASGRARLDAIARWLQDVAYRDVIDAGLEDRGSWVVRRMRMRVERFPAVGESLELRTFCSAAGSLAAERRTTIVSGQGLVEAVATWVFLDSDSWRPQRLGPEFDAVYGPSANGRRARTSLRHAPPPAGAEQLAWRFRAADLDIADHVNNAAYWEVAEELLASDRAEPGSLDVEIEFREPAQAGEALVLRDAGSLWITSSDGTLHASIAGLPL